MRHFILNVSLSCYKIRDALLTDGTVVGQWPNLLSAVAAGKKAGRRMCAWGIAMCNM
jgi:hypothetical protein